MTEDEMIEQLLQQINSLTATIDAQTQLIAQLNQTIQGLKEQLNKNSKSSSKPPSSDRYKKSAPTNLCKSSGKKVGGQNGHQGIRLAVTTTPDETVEHMPSACEGRPYYQTCKGTACISEKRNVIDAVVTVNVVEHRTLEIPICTLHRGTRKRDFPSDVNVSIQYGENLQVLSVALNTVDAVNIKRIHEILPGVFNIPIVTKTISNMVRRCADGLSATVDKIKQRMKDSALGHFNETGTRVDKKLWRVHNTSSCEYTYLDISPKRGFKGMGQCDVLAEFKGIAMHDYWVSYWNYPDIQHAVCCAHLLRELTGIAENHPGQKWAAAFINLLMEMKKAKEKAIVKGKESLSYYYLHKFDKKCLEFIEIGKKENPLPETTEKKRGRKKKGKIPPLVGHLADYKASVCLFAHSFQVPFDNDQAERDVRVIKVKTKVSGCFRTEEGAKDYLEIMSYIGAARKQGYNAYEATKNAISGNPDFIFTQRVLNSYSKEIERTLDPL